VLCLVGSGHEALDVLAPVLLHILAFPRSCARCNYKILLPKTYNVVFINKC
jgi:hypothetical protein